MLVKLLKKGDINIKLASLLEYVPSSWSTTSTSSGSHCKNINANKVCHFITKNINNVSLIL